MDTVAVEACPLCGSAERELLIEDARDFRFGVGGVWTYARCRSCDVVYETTRPADLGAGYPETYGQHRALSPPRIEAAPPAAGVKTWLRRAILSAHGYDVDAPALARAAGPLLALSGELRYTAFHASLIHPRRVPGGRLLDVGCGNGRFVSWARLVGWDVCGVERDPASAAIARQSSGGRIYTSITELREGEAARLAAAGNQDADAAFDVITANHVIEHVPAPAAMLAEIYPLLRPGGTVYVAVPNWDCWSRRLFGSTWFSLEPSRHLVMFTPGRLRRLVEDAGFVVESVSTCSVRARGQFAANWRVRFGAAPPPGLAAAVTLLSVLGIAGSDEIMLRGRRPL